jgi:rhodanese-related sulfurtransferase
MDPKNWCNIIVLCFVLLAGTLTAQQTQALCINPAFQQEVDSYLSYDVPVISIADAYAEASNYIFLDAREQEEYEVSHIKDAIHIGYDDFDLERVSHLDKNQPIIIYCSIGYRSEKIGEKLKDAGFQNVQNLFGSIFEWVNQHHPIYNASREQTNEIHTFNKKWSKWVQSESTIKTW